MEWFVIILMGCVMLGALALVTWLVVAVVRSMRVSRRLKERVGDLETELRKQSLRRDPGPRDESR